jgi:hydrogenase maturation protease
MRDGGEDVNLARVEEIANAVLYEGYMLYPYRPSSVKNRQRWNFGVLCPQAYCELEPGSESSFMQTQCLLRTDAATRLTVRVRFLQIVQRLVGRLKDAEAGPTEDTEPELEFVDRLEIGGRIYQPWQEAMERTLEYEALDPVFLALSSSMEFSSPGGDSCEYLRDAKQCAAGVIVRQWQNLDGTVQIGAEWCRENVFKVTVRVNNRSEFHPAEKGQGSGRDAALLSSLVSAHAILGAENGEFLSLLDPPAGFEELTAQCENMGAWPVLAGDDAAAVLASPIILYDYPKIAPESAGNLFDATEIDEILSLRILTLTEPEKREMRESDDRARELLERTESMPGEQFMKLHGALRGLTALKERPE